MQAHDLDGSVREAQIIMVSAHIHATRGANSPAPRACMWDKRIRPMPMALIQYVPGRGY